MKLRGPPLGNRPCRGLPWSSAGVSQRAKPNGVMRRLLIRIGLSVALVYATAAALPSEGRAQGIDFSKIDKFETLSTGTLRVGAPPKTIVDDGERHAVVLTIWDADAETKVFWRSPDGPQATVIPGRGVQTFQTLGELRLEAVGDPNHEVQYGYVLLALAK
jgi:hypothetical protein